MASAACIDLEEQERRVLADMDGFFADPSNNDGSSWGMASAALRPRPGEKFTGASRCVHVHSHMP